ncbi:MAG: stage II sporulation protein R [Clostridia bacterium]|nr:stage II sporulation protein R [Clostridia bacterium]
MSKGLMIFKEARLGQKYSTPLKIGVVLILTAIIVSGISFASYSEDLNKGLADNLVRLHVIANSDSEPDQALKRDVRDKIIGYMKDELNQSEDIEQSKYIISKNLNKIEEIARNEIERQGKSYSVKAMLGVYPFPTKAYGDITLPAGSYQALRVVIGKGEGANWWCVLFPPLCFVDATHGTIPDSVKKDLKSTLSAEEYKIITTADSDEDIPVKIKFKVVEFFQDSKIKFSGMINKIFKVAG